MSLTLIEVMAAVRMRRASLVAEIAGYLVLGAADQMAGAPRALAAGELLLLEEGTIRVAGGTAASPILAEQSLRELLRALLLVASSPTPALVRSGRRAPGSGVEGLVRELESALIPVNRAAARRALARLYRETLRAVSSVVLDLEGARTAFARATESMLSVSPPHSSECPAIAPIPALLDTTPTRLRSSVAAVSPPIELTPSPSVPIEFVESWDDARVLIDRSEAAMPVEEMPPIAAVEPSAAPVVVEALTRPEPVVVRASQRAREVVTEFGHTPVLGTLARPIELAAGGLDQELTDPMPEVELAATALPAPVEVEAEAASAPVAPAGEGDVVVHVYRDQDDEFAGDGELVDFLSDDELVDIDEGIESEKPPEAEAVPEAEAEAEAVPEPASEAEAVPEPAPEAVGEAEAVPEPEAATEAEPVPEPEPEAEAVPEAEAEPEPEPEVATEWRSPMPPPGSELEPNIQHAESGIESALDVPEAPSFQGELSSLSAVALIVSADDDPEFEPDVSGVEPESVEPESVEPETVALEVPSDAVEPFLEEPIDEPCVDAAVSAVSVAEACDVDPLPEPAVAATDLADAGEPRWELDAMGSAELAELPPPVFTLAPAEDSAELYPASVPYSAAPDELLPDEHGWSPRPISGSPPAELAAPPTPPTPAKTPPSRPAAPELAPPRYAPRKSDVSELLAGFVVAETRSDRELCRDLKQMAGVDLTPLPPDGLSLTPPPVETADGPPGADRARPFPWWTFAKTAGLILLLGFGARWSGRLSDPSAPAELARSAENVAYAPASRAASVEAASCRASVTLTGVPEAAQVRLRGARSDGAETRAPRQGPRTRFEGLPCRQPLEVTIAYAGDQHWQRIPVSAEELTPEPGHFEDVALTLAVGSRRDNPTKDGVSRDDSVD